MLELCARSALVTGGGCRVGSAIAVALGKERMRVAVHYFTSRGGAEHTAGLIEQAGGHAELIHGDLSDRQVARRVVDEAVERLGGLDLLVLNAAVFERAEYRSIDERAWDRTLELNLTAPWLMAQRATDALRRSRGSIVLVTCAATVVPFRNHLPYIVSKGALRHLMLGLALELGPEVRVNAVAPGLVLFADAPDVNQTMKLGRQTLLERPARPEDVASAVVFLARNESVTGQELVVDGGRVLARPGGGG